MRTYSRQMKSVESLERRNQHCNFIEQVVWSSSRGFNVLSSTKKFAVCQAVIFPVESLAWTSRRRPLAGQPLLSFARLAVFLSRRSIRILLGENLGRHFAPEPGVAIAIHFAHPARAGGTLAGVPIA
jgi:hypothetical protein